MFSKVLIANRGEIAVRIIQTCREMGIKTVAVHSSADDHALHVQRADEAYCLGPAPAAQSYLSIERVMEATVKSCADAVHPGYGFLSENPDFARAVEAAGLAFVGPPPDVIALLGDKVASKNLAKMVGLPLVRGYDGEDQSIDRFVSEAEQIGYPVMVKAAAGGGGRGMRAVSQPDLLPAELAAARREAAGAFADDRLFLERLVSNPRHVEFQVLVDNFDNALHLGERDCTVQRRHQKVLEEAPSVSLTEKMRDDMGRGALELARAAAYVNAGTVEFLVEGDEYHFLEMNTRIQVEHPVTEMVTGVDLIRLQLEIASGESLPLRQADVQPRGHAIEVRLYAEDPDKEFLPATGTLEVFEPPEGPGTRNDVGVSTGAVVETHYDPMLAKLIVHAANREDAVARLEQALVRYEVLGLTTNLPFLLWITRHPDFRKNAFDTRFLENRWSPQTVATTPEEVLMAAAAFDATHHPVAGLRPHGSIDDPFNPWRSAGNWRPAGTPRSFQYRDSEQDYDVAVEPRDDQDWTFHLPRQTRKARVETAPGGILLLFDGPSVLRFVVTGSAHAVTIAWRGTSYALMKRRALQDLGEVEASQGGSSGLSSPMPGTVVKVLVEHGQRVVEREPIMILEAMKMEHVIEAPHAGTVGDVYFAEGEMVPGGATVATLEAE